MDYQQEFVSQVEQEIRPLLQSHWEEIALNKDKIKLNPDWDRYYQMEKEGLLKVFTARDEGVLAGYFVVFVQPHIHYMDHVFACNDIIYLSPEYRKGFTGIRLIKFAEKCLKDDGVSVLCINTKSHKSFSKVLERIGYNPIEINYGKFLGD